MPLRVACQRPRPLAIGVCGLDAVAAWPACRTGACAEGPVWGRAALAGEKPGRAPPTTPAGRAVALRVQPGCASLAPAGFHPITPSRLTALRAGACRRPLAEIDPRRGAGGGARRAARLRLSDPVLACLACKPQSPETADCITAFLPARGSLRQVLTRSVLGLRPARRMRPPLLPLSGPLVVIQTGTGSATHRTGGNYREDKVQRFQPFTIGLTIFRPGQHNKPPFGRFRRECRR